MSTMASSYSISEWRSLGYDPEHEAVGSYLFTPRVGRGPRKANLRSIRVPGAECPYCHAPLGRLDPRDGRVSGRIVKAVRCGDVVNVAVEPVPRGYVVVKCRAGCKAAVFSMPKGPS